MQTDAAKLQALLDEEVAKRKAAEKVALDNKIKREKLETQYAQMMKELASASDGDAIQQSVRRFLHPHVDGPGRVAAASNTTSTGA